METDEYALMTVGRQTRNTKRRGFINAVAMKVSARRKGTGGVTGAVRENT